MTLDDAKLIAFNASQERLFNSDYRPTQAELRAIDMILIDQARCRLADQAATAHNGATSHDKS